MLTMLKNYLQGRETIRQLSRLSDRELADIGILRSEIGSIAYPAGDRAVAKPRTAVVARPKGATAFSGLTTQA